MKACKHCGREKTRYKDEFICTPCRLAYKKEWYQRNKEEVLRKQKAYYHANPDAQKERNKAYAITRANYKKEWYQKNKHRVVARIRNLSDSYVLKRLTSGTSLTTSDIPHELIEVKRLHLQLLRLLKEVS